MTARYRRGLVVGKFCPLHLGHEWLIGQALAQCAEVIVLSYSEPGFPGYEAERREGWIKARFPAVQTVVLDPPCLAALCKAAGIAKPPSLPPDAAPDDDHRHFVAWLCLNLLGKTVDAVFTSEDYGDGFARVLAAYFGHPVAHVCVDKARQRVPVSGRQIRADPHAWRQYLSPEVYAGLVRRVAILGGESTGKTTLSHALAERLGTRWAPEYGRERWEAKGGQLDYEDMLHIAQTQVGREERLAQEAHEWLVCDTTPLTTLFYCQTLFGQASGELHRLAERAYDLTLLCAPDFGFVQDGTRQGAAFRVKQHAWFLAELAGRGGEFQLITGTPAQRLAQCEALIAAARRHGAC